MHDLSPSAAISESMYRTLLLLGGTDNIERYAPASDGSFSVPLRLARWAALLLPFWLAVPPLLGWIVRTGASSLVRNGLRGHYLILGHGQIGEPLVRDVLGTLQANEDRRPSLFRAVVVVDSETAPMRLDAARALGAFVVVHDALEQHAFEAASAAHAHAIVVATGQSSRNIDIAGRLARYIAQARKNGDGIGAPPRLIPHIAGRRLMDWVKSEEGNRWRLGSTDPSDRLRGNRPEIYPFSVDQIALRQLFRKHPFDRYAAMRPVKRPHFVILGYDSLADWLIPHLMQAGLTAHLAGPRVTLIADSRVHSENAELLRQRIVRAYPFLDDGESGSAFDLKTLLGIEFSVAVYDFDALDRSLLDKAGQPSQEVQRLDEALAGTGSQPIDPAMTTAMEAETDCDPVTSIFVCFGTDERNLDVALRLQDLIRQHRRWLAPTFVRLYQDSGLEEVLSRSDARISLDAVIDDFGQDNIVCTREEIFDSTSDAAANRAHQVYLLGDRITELAEVLRNASAESADWGGVASMWQRACDAQERSAHGMRAERNDWLRFIKDRIAAHSGRAVERPLAVQEWFRLDKLEPTAGASLNWPAQPVLGELQAGRPPTANGVKAWLDKLSELDISTRVEAVEALLACLPGVKRSGAGLRTQRGNDARSGLKFEYVVSSRDQADHLPGKLRALGFRDIKSCGERQESASPTQNRALPDQWPLQDLLTGQRTIFDLASEERSDQDQEPHFSKPIEMAARLEHNRWMVERLMSGWRYAKRRDNVRRYHPSLEPYEQLATTPLEQAKDATAVLGSKHILRDTAADWRPECSIGIVAPCSPISHEVEKYIKEALSDDTLSQILFAHATAMFEAFSPERTKRMDASSEDIQAIADEMAMVLISTLDDGPNAVAADQVYDCARFESASLRGRRAFRLVKPRAMPRHLNDQSVLQTICSLWPSVEGYKYTEEQLDHRIRDDIQDWWEIDLAPEGLTLDEKVSTHWPADCERSARAGSDLALSPTQETMSEIFRRLRSREIDYLAERSDWLIVIDIAQVDGTRGAANAGRLSNLVSRRAIEVRERACGTSSAHGLPVEAANAEFSAHECDGGGEVFIDFESRYLLIKIGHVG